MTTPLHKKLIVGLASRTLFDLRDSHHIFETEGIEAYAQYQITKEHDVLAKGAAFSLAEKLLAIRHPETDKPLVEVILLSRNNADTGLRIFNSIQHYQLPIIRAAFTNGMSPYHYVSAFGAHLFLSTHDADVKQALQAGCAAATLLPKETDNTPSIPDSNAQPQVRIAFDGDAVLFSDEAERIYQTQGLAAFQTSEAQAANRPLPAGPFKGFLTALHHIQQYFPPETCPIRTALVTARSAPSHERVIRTLRRWNIRIDEALFLGGLSKGDFLKAFDADIFFDDQHSHCLNTPLGVATGHVPHGIVNDGPTDGDTHA